MAEIKSLLGDPIQELKSVVGESNVLDTKDEISKHLTDFSYLLKRMPLCIVFPKNLDETQQVFKIAYKYKISIIPRSSDVSFYGEGIPSEGGIMIKFSRMKKILKIDTRNKSVRLEAGLIWENLQKELKKHGVRICNPLLPHPKKSVLTTFLERVPILIPRFEYHEPLGPLEVVFYNGLVFRTGAAAGPGLPEEAPTSLVDPLGPGSMDFFRLFQGSEGTLSAVTWGTIKVEPLPVKEKLFYIEFDRINDVIPGLYEIQRRMIGYECFILNKLNSAIILAEDLQKDFKPLYEKFPAWVLVMCLGGLKWFPEDKLAYEEEILREITQKNNLRLSTSIAGMEELNEKVSKYLKSPWDKEPYWKFRLRGASHDVFFITTLEKVPEFQEIVTGILKSHHFPLNRMGCYIQPLEYGRACHVEYDLFYDKNPGEIEQIKTINDDLVKSIHSNGGFFSRPYMWASFIYEQASSFTNVLKKVKEIFDPENLMNPKNTF